MHWSNALLDPAHVSLTFTHQHHRHQLHALALLCGEEEKEDPEENIPGLELAPVPEHPCSALLSKLGQRIKADG
ncbi:hypothetical protein SKAU_G00177610 [Synaphobranchus kaupii]|uniref:Uncharacterized protein n=1 Tax=Synaphobranchus kaupii TaxID=118154 RepID=A0A9Q1FLQ8_SYNKA|nr:hypothetical protein SKAU_G00177610 [Synaphobranchus kaupii]